MKNFNIRSCSYFLTPNHAADFSDDGTRFHVYVYSPDGKRSISITYASDKERVYITDRLDDTDVPYEFRKNFTLGTEWKFNGMSKDNPELTPENIRALLDEIFHNFYDRILPAWEAEKAFVFSEENLVKYAECYNILANKIESDLQNLINDLTVEKVFTLSDHRFNRIKDYMSSIKSRIKHFRDNALRSKNLQKKFDYSDMKKILAGEEPYVGVEWYFDEIKKCFSNSL